MPISPSWLAVRGRVPWGAILVLGAVLSAWLYVMLLYDPRTLGPGPYYSDLYPRWVGTYEMLWNGKDPYSPEVEAIIQQGMFGRVLAPGDGIRDQQAFAYPLYTVFILAPLTLVPFGTLLPLLGVATLALLALTLWGWFAALGWWPGWRMVAGLILLGLSQPAAIQNVVLHQPTVLVIAFLVGAGVCLVRGHYALAGGLLALATIKPQLSLAIILWLSLWALTDWRRRGRMLLGLGGTMAVLLIGAWLLLPNWLAAWLGHLQRYQGYATERPILAAWLPDPLVLLVQIVLGLVLALFAWRSRHALPGSLAFNLGLTLPGLYSILVLPVWTAYNQILLFPAALLVLHHRTALLVLGRAGRLLYALTTSVLIWPYVASAIWVLLMGRGRAAGKPGVAGAGGALSGCALGGQPDGSGGVGAAAGPAGLAHIAPGANRAPARAGCGDISAVCSRQRGKIGKFLVHIANLTTTEIRS